MRYLISNFKFRYLGLDKEYMSFKKKYKLVNEGCSIFNMNLGDDFRYEGITVL